MKKIAIIGAGSVSFAKKLVNDFLFLEPFKDAQFRLMDIDNERLNFALNTMEIVKKKRNANASFITTNKLEVALDGADFVITLIQVNGVEGTQLDFEICKKYGIELVIGDSMGVPAISRTLRTAPAMLKIAHAMEKYCPDAYLLNYTNPMGMLMSIILRGSKVKGVGLCHGVWGTARRMSEFIGIDHRNVNYLCAGINHMAFFLKFEQNGQDLYPQLQNAFDNKYRNWDLVRQSVYRKFGYFMTESSYHLSEYLPYFLKSEEIIKSHDIPIGEMLHRNAEAQQIYEAVSAAFKRGENLEATGGKIKIHATSKMRTGGAEAGEEVEAFQLLDEPSGEYAVNIANAIVTGENFVFNGNILNHNYIDNLPYNSCVEVPCLVNKNGIAPVSVGAIPAQCAALIQTNINVQELTTLAMLEENIEHIYHAAYMCPLASSQLSLDKIKMLTDDLLKAHHNTIPDWAKL